MSQVLNYAIFSPVIRHAMLLLSLLHAGNNWGVCPDGEGRDGCGPQEEFRSCADIAITSGGASGAPPPSTLPASGTGSASDSQRPADNFPSSVEFPNAWAPPPPAKPTTTVKPWSWWNQQQPQPQPQPQRNYVFVKFGGSPVVSYGSSGGSRGKLLSAPLLQGEPLSPLPADEALENPPTADRTVYARKAVQAFQETWRSAVGYLAGFYQ